MAEAAGVCVCPLCASPRVAHRFDTHGYPLYRCADCTVRFFHPQPDDTTLAAIYDATYFIGPRTPELEAQVAALKRATAEEYLNVLVRQGRRTTGRLLELGCGGGDFLQAARARGFDVQGIEISPHAVAIANRRLGADCVIVGTLDTAPVRESAYDIVAFTDVIEHVRQPLDFLRRVQTLLKPGGLAFLVTPSLDSWSARCMGRYWMEYKVEHLYYFNRRSVARALTAAGLIPLVMEANRKILSWDYLYRHFQRFPVPVFTPCIRLARRALPDPWACRPRRLPASGLFALARKPDARTT